MLEMAQATFCEQSPTFSRDYSSSFDSLNDIPEDIRDIVRDIDVYSPQGSVRLFFSQLDFN